jgi:hypothetical protein
MTPTFFVYIARAEQARKKIFRFFGRRRIGGVRPKHCRSVADLDAMAAFPFQKVVERGRVGEGGGFGDRRVVALLVSIGGEGVDVKGHQRGARRLGAPDAFDRRMKPRDRSALSCDEAGRLRFLAR